MASAEMDEVCRGEGEAQKGENKDECDTRSTEAQVDPDKTEETQTNGVNNIQPVQGEILEENNFDIGDVSKLDGIGRNKLFQQGQLFEQKGRHDLALKCYLGCLSGLTTKTNFPLLPQCLRSVADLYSKEEDYERAIPFIQAQKLFYQNALIDISALQKQIHEQTEGVAGGDTPTLDSVRAEEYEQLARRCLETKQPQLALEYAGKATKIRQSVFGVNHPTTKQSLDFFSSVCAEAGKLQCTDSITQQSAEIKKENEESTPVRVSFLEDKRKLPGETTPASILRNRNRAQNGGRRKSGQHVRFQDSVDSREQAPRPKQREEAGSNRVLVMMLLFSCALLGILGGFLYCHLFSETSTSCDIIQSNLYYACMKIKYFYQYMSAKLFKYA